MGQRHLPHQMDCPRRDLPDLDRQLIRQAGDLRRVPNRVHSRKGHVNDFAKDAKCLVHLFRPPFRQGVVGHIQEAHARARFRASKRLVHALPCEPFLIEMLPQGAELGGTRF